MKTYFAVSDVHSYYTLMINALTAAGFERDNPNHIVIVCGDAFDRGDESNEMFKWLVQMYEENRLMYVRGNHEDLLNMCAQEATEFGRISPHHVSNGTVQTISDITEFSKNSLLFGATYRNSAFEDQIRPLLKFINNATVDFFELGSTVFVHGWVPTLKNNLLVHVPKDWRSQPWEHARWSCGIEQYHHGIVPTDVKKIVCGHWHTSFGWSKYKQQCSEFGANAIFDPYITTDDSCEVTLIAIDACTAFSKKVNCVVFDESGNILRGAE